MSQDTPRSQLPEVVFLVGTAHTGKTEVSSALRVRRGTFAVRRAYFWRNEYGRCGPLSHDENLSRSLRRLGGDEYLGSAGFDRGDLARLGQLANRSYGSLFLHVTAEAARRLVGESGTIDYLVVQIGGLERIAPVVARDIPGATFIHMIRDPRRYFGGSSSGLGRLGWKLASWSASATSALVNSRELPDRYLVVRGEDLIEAPVSIGAVISGHVGVDVTLKGAGSSLSAKGSVLGPRQALIVERLVGHQLEALGYRVGQSSGLRTQLVSAVDVATYHLRSQLDVRERASA